MNTDGKGYPEMSAFLDNWSDDSNNVKKAFIELLEMLLRKDNTHITFMSRPGVSYSLRAYCGDTGDTPLFALVDIIDDDPRNRWLSVCFYEYTITDDRDLGNVIQGGILGEDGLCFDLMEYDETLMVYLKEKIDEAYER